MAQFPQFIFGVHDPEGAQIMLNAGKPGWVVASIKVNPPDHNGDFAALANAGIGVLAWLNNGYGSEGTIPPSAQHDQFAQQCASFVAGSQGVKVWIIGKETNAAWERPGNDNGQGGEVLTPQIYARCFAKVRGAIKRVPGHANDWVMPGAPAPRKCACIYH